MVEDDVQLYSFKIMKKTLKIHDQYANTLINRFSEDKWIKSLN